MAKLIGSISISLILIDDHKKKRFVEFYTPYLLVYYGI